MTKPIPDGMHTLTPVLALNGAAHAIEFFARAFGAEEISRAPDPTGTKIWHAAVRIGNSTMFVTDMFENAPSGPVSLWVYTHDVDAAWKRAVDAGCQVRMPVTDMFWGDRMGVVTDEWGNQWTLAQHTRDLTPAEMKAEQDRFVASMKP